MSIEIKVPSVGESITSGLISVWHQKSGAIVKSGDPLFTLETDKVSTEITAQNSGQLTIVKAEGEEVKIGEIVGSIDESVSAPSASAEAIPSPKTPAKSESKSDRSDRLSPAVRVAVEENKLDPKAIKGTGKQGQITKPDVVSHLETQTSEPESNVTPIISNSMTPTSERETRKRLSPLRRKIAQHLVSAQQNAAILTTFNECDMTAIQELRAKAQDSFTKRHGVKLGFMSFFIKATVEALKAVPAINGRMDGEDFIQNHYYDIGVAVGTEKGLVVPVIRYADQKTFAEIEKDLAAYATKAREGKISIDDLSGGVFTISNGGIYGSLMSTPILNPPQSGILGMHKIQPRPIALDGQVVIRPMMYLALSYDHRVVDGKEAVTFLVRIKDCLEDPVRLLIEF